MVNNNAMKTTMKTKHTPDPWVMEPNWYADDGDPATSIQHLAVVNHEVKEMICSITPMNCVTDKDMYNGQLIISAPKMLEALVSVLKDWRETGTLTVETTDKVEAITAPFYEL